MGWGSALSRVVSAGAAGVVQGRSKRAQMDKEEMREALILEQRQRQERRAQETFDLNTKNINSQIADRDRGKPPGAWHPTTKAEAVEFEREKRLIDVKNPLPTRSSSRPPQALDPTIQRQKFIDQRRRELMRSTKGLGSRRTPGLSARAAQQQAGQEADEVFGAAGGSRAPQSSQQPPKNDRPGNIDLREPRKATAAEEDAALDEAGGDPSKAAAILRKKGLS